MLIQLPANVHFGQLQVLAVNLDAFQRIIIHKVNDNVFDLALDSILPVKPEVPVSYDPATQRVVIKSYSTYQAAIEDYQSMMEALLSGKVLWSPENTQQSFP